MKNILLQTVIIFMVVISTLAKSQHAVQKGYSIRGRLKGLHDGTLLYLTRGSTDEKSLDTISTTKSHGEKFEFQGRLTEEMEGESYFIYLDTLDTAYKPLKQQYVLLHLENSTITLTGSLDNMSPHNIHVTGSKVHEDLLDYDLEYTKTLSSYRTRYREIWAAIAQITRSKNSSDSSRVRLIELNKEKAFIEQLPDNFKANWVQSHISSLISPWLLLQTPDSVQKELYQKLTAHAQSSYYGIQVKKNIATSNNLQIGHKAPELNLQAPDGQHLSMLTIASRHKLTIVDFWAFWCTPCRKSFPKLKEIYEKYHSKGLAIYGVSVDSRKQDWLKAIKDDELPWHNVIISAEGINPAKELYGVSAIPVSLLLDQEGNILLRWAGVADEDALNAYLSRL